MHQPTTALLTVLLTLSLACPAAHAGREVHVSPEGDDAAAGTETAPLRTVTAAAAKLEPGDVCIVHAGTYRETIRPPRSGSAEAPIRFVAEAGHDTIITGTDRITGWEQHEGDIWRAAVDERPEQVFIDRDLARPAQYPNASGDPFEKNTIPLMREGAEVTGDDIDQPEDQWKGATLWALDTQRGWVAHQYEVIASEPGKITLDTDRGWWPDGNRGYGYLYGVMAALDEPGEWHYEDGHLYVHLEAGARPDDHRIEGRVRTFGFDLTGREHIHIEGFALEAASLNFDEARHCRASDLHVVHINSRFGIRGGFNRDDGIDPDAEGLGIVLGGENNAIEDSRIAHGAGDGVSIFGKNNTLRNCMVHDFNTSATDCAPVNVTGRGHVIEHNTLYNSGRSILVHRRLREGRILHNHMFNAGLLTRDLGMTYTYQTDGEGTEIAFNRIHHNHARPPGCVGIYIDDQSSNHVVHHNLVFAVSEAIALNPPDSRDNLVANNTLVGLRVSVGMSRRRPQDMTGTRFVNNIFTAGRPRTAHMPNVTLENNLERDADPKFIDPANHDYRLQPDSPARGAGKPIDGITDHHPDQSPDMGAFPHGKDPWEAGSSLEPYPPMPEVDLEKQWEREQ